MRVPRFLPNVDGEQHFVDEDTTVTGLTVVNPSQLKRRLEMKQWNSIRLVKSTKVGWPFIVEVPWRVGYANTILCLSGTAVVTKGLMYSPARLLV